MTFKIIGKIKSVKKKTNYELVITTDETNQQDLLIIIHEQIKHLLHNFKLNDKVILSVELIGTKNINEAGKIEYINIIQCYKMIKYNLDEVLTKSRKEKYEIDKLGDLPF